jgi:NTE family protein
VNWDVTLAGRPPYRQLSFRRKEDEVAFPTRIELGFKGGIKLPPGLSSGHGVGLMLSRFASRYTGLSTFDNLPTPFRCVATDLAEGRAVVFDSGDLFDALRATMSLPGIFAPVRLGNRVLVDGGVLNNLPVDVVKQMGADIVIAVPLDLAPEVPKIDTLLEVAGRAIDVIIMENERRNLGIADLVIMPEVKDLKSRDFNRLDDFRKAGYEAAERKKSMLERFSVSEAEWTAYLEHRRSRRLGGPVTAQKVEIVGEIAPRRATALIQALQGRGQGSLDQGALEREMTKLTGMGRFDSADYRVVGKDGEKVLRVHVHEKIHGPPFLKAGILIDGNQTEGLKFGVGARLVFLDAGGPASEWRWEANVGRVNHLASEYYWRLSGTKWFLAPQASWEKTGLSVYDGSHRLSGFSRASSNFGADFGFAFGRFQEVRLGYSAGWLNTVTLTGSSDVEALEGGTAGLRARWSYDGTDSAVIPTRGVRATLEGSWFNAYPGINRNFPSGTGQLTWARSFRDKFVLLGQAEGGGSVRERSLSTLFDRGGLFRLSALARHQLLGGRFYYGSATLLRSLPVGGRFYGMIGWEFGNAWNYSQTTPGPVNDGIFGLLGETPLGLLFLGGAVGEQGEGKALFRIGRYF